MSSNNIGEKSKRSGFSTTVKLALTLGALILILVHLKWPGLSIDAITIGLLVFAALPWLSEFLESLTLPGGWGIKWKDIAQRQDQQQHEINALKFLVSHLLTRYESEHLETIANRKQFLVEKSPVPDIFMSQLRHMLELEFIERTPDHHMTELDRKVKNLEKVDVNAHLNITKAGREYLNLRSQFDLGTSVQDDN